MDLGKGGAADGGNTATGQQSQEGMCPCCLAASARPAPRTPAPTSNKQLNPSSSLDLLFESVTLGLQVGRVPIQDMGVFWVNVNVLEEFLPHEGVVTLLMVSG